MRNLKNEVERRAMGDEIARVAAQIDVATQQLLALLVEFDRAEGWGYDGAQTFAHWLSWRVGWSLGTAREHIRVAHALADLPRMRQAMASGQVSYSKVRAMTRVATPHNEELLLDYSAAATAAQLDRICSAFAATQAWHGTSVNHLAERRRVTRRPGDDGLVTISITCTQDEADRFMKAVDSAARETSQPDCRGGVSRVDGAMTLAESFLRGENAERQPTEVVVNVPAGALQDDPTARRLACDAGLVTILEDEAGKTLDVGRKTRTLPAALKRALLRRDDGCCTFPGCPNRMFVEAHHVRHWADGGETELGNLVTICSWHHRYLHEHGWTVRLGEDQRPAFFHPNGQPAERFLPRPAVDGLSIEPPPRRSTHTGERYDLGLCIEGLVNRNVAGPRLPDTGG